MKTIPETKKEATTELDDVLPGKRRRFKFDHCPTFVYYFFKNENILK